MFREGYASKILADVMRIIVEENIALDKNTKEGKDKNDENKENTEDSKHEDIN